MLGVLNMHRRVVSAQQIHVNKNEFLGFKGCHACKGSKTGPAAQPFLKPSGFYRYHA